MSFFQNVFTYEFEGNWLLGDRHHIPTFIVKPNTGRSAENVMNWVDGPFDLSGQDSEGADDTDTLNIVFALNDSPTSGQTFKNWSTISVNITQTASDSSVVQARDIIADLNADTLFAERFEASFDEGRIAIRMKRDETSMRFYIQNGQAEDVLQFNQRAGVSQIPSFFDRHTMENRFNFEDCQNLLIPLDPANGVHERIIDEAVDPRGNSLGLDSSNVLADWELLEGRSGIFEFTNQVDSTTQVIYSAGSAAGGLARKIITDGNNTFNIPHTLEASDIITPP